MRDLRLSIARGKLVLSPVPYRENDFVSPLGHKLLNFRAFANHWIENRPPKVHPLYRNSIK